MEYDVNKIEFVKTQKTNTSYKRANNFKSVSTDWSQSYIFKK